MARARRQNPAAVSLLPAVQVAKDNAYKTIPLTQGKVAIVDADDYAMLIKHKWIADKKRRDYCACRSVGPRSSRKTIYMHRVILGAGPHEMVDHINGDGLDNRKANIRKCTHAENQRNIHARNSICGFKGVTKVQRNYQLKKPWVACITVGCKQSRRIHLGYFENPVDAAHAYDHAAQKYFGEFANCNFPKKQVINATVSK
ncbi:MAG TPA: endonuclease [Nitrospiraceae bacterium]|nr:endonuclease [Nitrospiraceae bacterium]